MDARPMVQRKRQRKQTLWTELQPWLERYRRLSRFVLPFTGRWLADDANKARSGYNDIWDSTATEALYTTAAGLFQRASSPASPWMKLAVPDPDLNNYHAVKVWLEEVSDRMLRVFSKSNTYRALPRYYTEMLLYGTACGVVQESERNVIHHYPLTAGQYALATDAEENVNVMYREFRMTVAQMVDMFGLERVSASVRSQWERGNFEDTRTICHAIEPREHAMRQAGRLDGMNKPWRSVYFEFEGKRGNLPSEPLSEGGYDIFPVLAPRWTTSGGDVYGNSPGMQVLGDVVALQQATKRKGQAIDFKTMPPTHGPRKLQEIDQRPGGHTETSGEIKPTFDARYLDLADLREDIGLIQQRIREGFKAFLFLLQSTNPQDMTAEQARYIQEEKMTLLGPTQERIENELLKPLVDITFDIMWRQGQIPPPPPELGEGADLTVEFLSPLAQAQRAVGASVDDRVQMKAQTLAETSPEILDLFDADEHFREFVAKVGGSPKNLRSPEKVQEVRESRAAAQAAQAQSEMMAQGASTAKDIAQAEGV